MRSVLAIRHGLRLCDRVARISVGLLGVLFSSSLLFVSPSHIISVIAGVLGGALLTSGILDYCPVNKLWNRKIHSTATEESSQGNSAITATTDAIENLSTSKPAQTKDSKLANFEEMRLKLYVSISVPLLIVFLISANQIIHLSHDLDVKQILSEHHVTARLTLKQHELEVQNRDSEVKTLSQVISTTKAPLALLIHDDAGKTIPSARNMTLVDHTVSQLLLEAIRSTELSSGDTTQGWFDHNHNHYLWTSVGSKNSDIWATILINVPMTHSIWSFLFSSKLVILFAAVLWFAIWSCRYVTIKFREKMTEGQRELEYNSRHDGLTGLPNMMQFETILYQRLPPLQSIDKGLTVMVLDLSNFRDVNDTLGYKLGDQLLKNVASGLTEVMADHGNVFRVSADVFSIISTATEDHGKTIRLANRIHDSLELHKELKGVPINVSGRIGIASYPVDTADPKELMRLADIALAQAKNLSWKTCHYQAEKDTHSVRKLSLLARMRGAIENNEMSLVYQPKVDIQNNKIEGVEALVRWVDSEYGAVSPIEFVTWAEKSGLIDKLTHWVLRSATAQSLEWRSRGIYLPIAVNLSPLNLTDPDLIPLVHELLHTGNLSSDMLELELTENAVMNDPTTALKTMSALHDMGINFAIDDFGTGLSSFTYLRKFPINHLKIDRVFVMDPDLADRDSVLLKSMINLGHSLQCVVTAEGVEDQTTLERLQEFGCDYVQGYHVARPMTGDDLLQWYSSTEWNPERRAA